MHTMFCGGTVLMAGCVLPSLKSRNVMLASALGTQQSVTAKITDFGTGVEKGEAAMHGAVHGYAQPPTMCAKHGHVMQSELEISPLHQHVADV